MDISHQIKTMTEVDFPDGLHGKIMRRVLFLKLRKPFLIINLALFLNLMVSGWRIWARILENNSLSALEAIWDGFELSFNYVSTFISTAFETLPIWSISIFIVNIFLIGYVFFIASQLRKIDLRNVSI